MSNLEKLSKENLIDELMLDSVKGGCCGWTARTTGGTNSTDSKRDRPGVAMEEQQYQAVEDKAIEPLLADESAIAFPR